MKIGKETKEVLERYYNLLIRKPLEEQLEILEMAIERMTGTEFRMKEELKPGNDREILESIQATYSIMFCLLNGINYRNFDIRRYIKEDKYFDWILTYKVEHFSKEILEEMGIEIVRRTDKGIIVRDIIPTRRFN